jgi:hypothetical protein
VVRNWSEGGDATVRVCPHMQYVGRMATLPFFEPPVTKAG